MSKLNKRNDLKILLIVSIVVSIGLLLDVFMFKLRPWPYVDGGGSDYLYLKRSLFFEQYASHCLYFSLNILGILTLLIIPFLSLYTSKNYLFSSNETLLIPNVLQNRIVKSLIVCLFVLTPFLVFWLLEIKHSQTDPGYDNPVESKQIAGFAILSLIPMLVLFSSIITSKKKKKFSTFFILFMGTILYLFGFNLIILFSTLCA